MALGYTRQSAGSIVTGGTIQASHFNNEYNAIQSFADSATGHSHDGTTGGGAKIPTAGIVGFTSTTAGIVAATGSNTWANRTITGTAGKITVTNGSGAAADPTITIDSTYVGQNTITTVGTVTTGTWSGSFGAVSGANLTNLTAANISAGTAGINITGNAATATKLLTARSINGTSFDGTSDITITAAAGTLTGTILNSTVVTSSLTTVGTIGTGVWNATAIGATVGGTGQTSYAVGDILYASTTTALSKLADVATGNALISGGAGVAPSYGKIGLTTHISGVLPPANGGTGVANSNTITLAGDVTHTGAFSRTFNATGTTSITLPTTGTLATLSGTETFTNKTIDATANTLLNLPNVNINRQIFTSSGTFTYPTGTKSTSVFKFTITGGGGAGGGSGGGYDGGSGGGAAGTSWYYETGRAAGQTSAITIGAGGSPGAAGAAGNAGGTSSVVFLAGTVSATGGGGGPAGKNNIGGTVGSASGPAHAIFQGGGGLPACSQGNAAYGGNGGNSIYGGGGRASTINSQGAGESGGVGAGGGGGYSASAHSGAAGGQGAVIVEWVL